METITLTSHGRPAHRLVTAYVRQAPPEPPGGLRRWLVPVTDDQGRVLDFDLDVAVLVANLEPGRIGPAVAAHRRWQRTHAVAIDEAGELSQLAVDCAMVGLELLSTLGSFPCELDAGVLEELDLECQEAELMLAGVDRVAWEFTDAGSTAVLRASAPGGPVRLDGGVEPVDWEIELSPARGLRVRVADEIHKVEGWMLRGDGLRLDVDGGTCDVHGPVASAVARLAPGAVRVEVRPVPVARAHAGRLQRLRAGALAGRRAGSGVVLLEAGTS